MRRLEFSAEGGSRQRGNELEGGSGSRGVRTAVLAAAVLVAGGLYSRDQGRPFLRAPAAVDFGAVDVGAAGVVAAIPLRNAGLGRLQIGTITVAGVEVTDYTIANDRCSSTELEPGETCLVDVQFEAAGAGLRMAELVIGSGATPPSRTISLRGEGIQSLVASIVPGRLEFGGHRVGSTSPIQLARLRNESATPFRVESIEWREFAEDFQIVHENCSARDLDAGGECEIGVEFTPVAEGTRSAIVAVHAAGSERFMLGLDGSGVASGVTIVEVFPRTIDFGAKNPTESLPALPVTIRVSGDEAVTVISAHTDPVSAGFAIATDDCSGRTLQDGQECSLQVRFDGTATGAHAARLEVLHDRSPDPEIISVDGEIRSETIWSVQVSPDLVDFGEQMIGTAPTGRVVQFKNLSSNNIDLEPIRLEASPPGGLTIADDGCGGRTFAPQAGCEIRVSFGPRSAGDYRASLRFSFRSPLAARVVEVRGTAKVPPPQPLARLVVDPARIDFGSRPPGDLGEARTVTVTNQGDAMGLITTTRLTGLDAPDFAIRGNDCSGRSLSAGQSCRIEIAFVGKIAGKRLAALEIANDSGAGPLAVSLNGEVARVLEPAQLSMRPGGLVFPAVKQGERPPRKVLVIVNQRESPGKILSVRLGGASPRNFAAATEGCSGRTLGAGESCQIQVAFVGREPGRSAATVQVENDGVNRLLSATIEGEIVRNPEPGRLVARPVSVVFPSRNEGERPQGSVVAVSNEGQSPVGITAIGLGGASPSDFVIANQDCSGSTIVPGRECQIEVVLIRSKAGRAFATLDVAQDAPGPSLSVPLSGEVLPTSPPPRLQFVPGRLSMGPYRMEERLRTARLTLLNDGQTPAQVGAIRFEGPNPSAFAIGNEDCGGRILAGGERCEIEVAFTGSQPGDSVAGLLAAYDGPGGAAKAVIEARLVPSLSPSGPAEFIVRPPRLGFEAEGMGARVSPQEVTVFNNGRSPGRVNRVGLLGNDGNFFAILNDGCRGAQIAPNDSCRILVSFSARTSADRRATLSIDHDAPGPPLQVSLQGTVNRPPAQPPRVRIVLSPPQFESQAVGTTSAPAVATVINEGGTGAVIRGVQIQGQFGQEFRTVRESCSGRTLPPAARCEVMIVFTPRGAGTRSGALEVSVDGGTSASARLLGTGSVRTPTGGFGLPRPGDITLAQPPKVCPDPAAVLFRPSLVKRDSEFAGTVRLQGAMRNEGDPFQPRPGQQSLQILEVGPGGGSGRVLQNLPFGSLQQGQTVSISANVSWRTTNEFPPNYLLVITYEPDISADGNPSNDDCNGRNNQQSITAAQINSLFRSTRPQVQPRVPPQLRQQPAPRIR